jgi:hypothetical protein
MVSMPTSNVSTSHKDVPLKDKTQGTILTLTNLLFLVREKKKHTHNLSFTILCSFTATCSCLHYTTLHTHTQSQNPLNGVLFHTYLFQKHFAFF